MRKNLLFGKSHPWRWIALMTGMMMSFSTVKATSCDLYIQLSQSAPNTYDFEAVSYNCSLDDFSLWSWEIYDANNNLIFTTDDVTSFSYAFNSTGNFHIFLYAYDISESLYERYTSIYIFSTCSATGTLDTIETNYSTGYAKFRLTSSTADRVRLVFDSNDDTEGETLSDLAEGTVSVNHTYSLNNPEGINYRYPYAWFINTTENCSTAVYMPNYGSLKFLNKHCGVRAYAYFAYDNNYNYIPYAITFYAFTYNTDESNISVKLYHKGSLIDEFTLNDNNNYYLKKNYTFAKAGGDTLIITSNGQYCVTTDTIEIYVPGKPCPANLSLTYKKTDPTKNIYKFTFSGIKDSGFTYYWEVSGHSIYLNTTTTDSTLTLELPTDEYIHIWAYALSDDCNTYWYYTNVITGNLNCYAYFSYGYDETPRTILLYNYSAEGKVYQWDFGDGQKSTAYNPENHTYAKDGLYTITLTVYDPSNNCVKTYQQNVTIGNVDCKADFVYAVNGQVVNFTNLSEGAQYIYWYFGDYQYSEQRDPSHTYASPGIYEVYLWVYNASGESWCWDQITKKVVIGNMNDVLAAGFDYYSQNNSTYYFSDASIGKPTKWYWTFGDGTYSSTKNPQKTYTKAGVYSVCLTVTNAAGATSSSCKTIWAGNTDCSTIASFTSRISGKNVSFTNRSSGDYDRTYWDFGDGTSSNETSPAHAYAADGFYAVTLTVRKSGTDCADTYTDYVQIGSVDCRADFTYSVDAATRTVNLAFSGKGGSNPYLYWIFDDGDYAETSTVTKTFDNAGKHEVWLVVYDLNTQCMDYTSKVIQVDELACLASFTYYVDSSSNKAWCINKSVGDNLIYLWEFGDGTYSTDVNPTHTFKKPGYYTIGLTAYNPVSWCLDYFETTVLISGRGIDCEADFAYLTDHTTRKVRFSDQSKGNIVDYIWDFGDGTISNQAKPEKTYNRPGAYNVCLTVWNDNDIPNMTCKRIRVGLSDEIRCEADFGFMVDASNKKVIVVDKSVGNPTQYLWNFGDGSTATNPNNEHVYSQKGYYLISLDITTARGCESFAYKVVNIGMPDTLLYLFDYRVKDFNQKAGGYPVDFIGAGLGDAARLKWDFGDGNTSTTSSTPTHVYAQPGTYTVCVTATDPITGDSSTYCQQITVTSIRDIAGKPVFSLYPNPAKDVVTLSFYTPANGMVHVEILDLSGRRVAKYAQWFYKGNHTLPMNIKSLPAGSFVVKINSSQNAIGKAMLVKK